MRITPIDDADVKSNKEIIDEEIERIIRTVYRPIRPLTSETQYTLSNYDTKFLPEEKKDYSQNWSLYEKACSQEKLMFLKLLKDAVDYLNPVTEYKGNGRPPVDYGDIIKSLCIKGYHNFSSWRTGSELRIARAMGVIEVIHKRSTLNKYMKDPLITPYLHKLYKIMAEPLKEVELYFAADATGFSNSYGNNAWRKLRHTPEEQSRTKEYTKLHIITGVKTNIIATAKITEGKMHESPFFKPLLDDTVKMFNVKEISADAGYLSKDNAKAARDVGTVPYIMPKKNVHVSRVGPASPWNLMLRMWKNHQMYFATHYHRRSNVESTFGALKRKFGDSVRCKDPVSRENEILCKVVCYNTSVLAEALLSYDLDSGFLASL